MADAGLVINRAAELAKEKTTLTIADGEFIIRTPMVFKNKGMMIEGAENTVLRFYHDGPAITATRNKSTNGSFYLRHLHLINGINDIKHQDQHCIISHMPIEVERCRIENFFGDGIHLTGNGGSGRPEDFGQDVSFAYVAHNYIFYCRGNGIYLQGGDSNAGTYFKNDIRDNWGYGTYDNSFLGNTHVGTMAHNNRRGNYIAPGPNNCAHFSGCYSEGGSPLSYMAGSARVEGGLWDGGVILEANATANLFGKQLTSRSEGEYIYKRIFFEWVGDNFYSTWLRKVRNNNTGEMIDQFQWRLYNKTGDVYIDKSDRDFDSKEEAIQDVQNRLNVK